jgi:Ca2+-binding RTX toxin-like protein
MGRATFASWLLVTVGLSLGIFATTATATHDDRCTGEVIGGTYLTYGTDTQNTCNGHSGPDVMYAYGANDDFYSTTGHDQLQMGSGGDVAHGGDGNDRFKLGARHG